MNTDCAFYIGTTHEVCQDYALSGKNSIAVSDGCSGSPQSDIGSRVLSITAMNKMVDMDSLYHFDQKECISLARPAIKMLDISNKCLDATLLIVKYHEEKNCVEAMCSGDGVIVIGTKTGRTIVIDCAYIDNYPFYMNYYYDKTGRLGNWDSEHNKREITQTIIDPDGEIISTKILSDSDRLDVDLGIIIATKTNIIINVPQTEGLVDYVAIMSDGIHSFYEKIITETSKCNQAVNYLDVLKELLTFKNFNSSFVQRRINKFRKNCIKKNWANADDFSLAAIYMG